MNEINYTIGDIVRIDDAGYPGLYEITGEVDISVYPQYFDYDFFATNDECESGKVVKRNELILVCKAEKREDIKR